MSLLPRDQAIGGAVYLAGVLIYAVAIVAGWKLVTAGAGAPAKQPMGQRTGG
jgi:hypothetical protein